MLKQDMLQAFEKHLGALDTQELEMLDTRQKSSKIEKFSHEIKSLNESIGALQVLQIACNKLLKLMPLSDTQEGRMQMQEVINKAQFLGHVLFDTPLVVTLEQTSLSIEVNNPLKSASNTEIYLQEKLEEIKEALLQIQESVSSKQVFRKTPTLNTPSFNKDTLDFMKTS
ncbi:flagellar FLiS export co-chaperone [Helicobacter suis]|uniref:flagellar FLiS export co-chaperone n=1 Tax=Helicobacter suis TaxID=104628 RepID=UPI001F086D88|nr:flagellar FLiS export co-chaperone [Helicobacter suis]